MRVIIENTPQQVAQWTARYIVEQIRLKSKLTSSPFVLGLPTGSTPLETYKELIRLYKAGEVSFKNVITFNMDEYVGLPEEHPESYHSFMWNNFFRHIDIVPENVNILNGNAEDLVKECADYEARIEEAGGIDLFMGGVGEDGHLAFNEPFSSLQSRTRIKTLTTDTIQVNARFFGGDTRLVPKTALTVGVATVLSAKKVIILATGHKKARAVRHGVEGGYNHQWTISALQVHPNGIIVCDDAAAEELRVSTYRYFKDIEKDTLLYGGRTRPDGAPHTDARRRPLAAASLHSGRKTRGSLRTEEQRAFRIPAGTHPSSGGLHGRQTGEALAVRMRTRQRPCGRARLRAAHKGKQTAGKLGRSLRSGPKTDDGANRRGREYKKDPRRIGCGRSRFKPVAIPPQGGIRTATSRRRGCRWRSSRGTSYPRSRP